MTHHQPEPVRFLAVAPYHWGVSAVSETEARRRLRGAGYSRRRHIVVVELVPPLDAGAVEIHPLSGPMLPADCATRIVHDTRDDAGKARCPRPFAHTRQA